MTDQVTPTDRESAVALSEALRLCACPPDLDKLLADASAKLGDLLSRAEKAEAERDEALGFLARVGGFDGQATTDRGAINDQGFTNIESFRRKGENG